MLEKLNDNPNMIPAASEVMSSSIISYCPLFREMSKRDNALLGGCSRGKAI